MSFATDIAFIKATIVNMVAQYAADLARKPSLTWDEAYRVQIAEWNALEAEGVFTDQGDPSEVFTQAASWLAGSGFPELAAIYNTQEGEGAFAEWPIVYVTPP